MLGASLVGCSKKQPASLPPSPDEAPFASSTNGGVLPGSQADFLAQMNGRDTIYFDTDMYNIDGVDALSLKEQAAWLNRYPYKSARIEGHCDERGTREYNLALGERRANAAKNYLVSLGIPAQRLSIISYGKERPIALGSDEASWEKNRRAVTVTID
ncbi:peptidoglycan-associated lipoprotein Pal [Croceicoccus mobilis]|nr:peptidoglycan-associated lipoprotein Pal [Croceicoccus mobilis]